ncbi:dimethyl sulfoxide reductase anchor subunit [Mannheimia sp. AT1]|uniref:Dimethyl sulfoxide reductase anchor subunit n=1 Tax=Mannheimia cairinae TaxID=3025936 RepID=A0ABT5MMV6_9PAST|nr:DmsC/YnfH family molybdoenzyme membrane anchor subunit [Mannheimia cairinae]MDD0823518.1 dimethyl sulfoxide reductase anchor subunit [Mannheimia cairinae]MDD0826731.1 dimethyl sulfoxide reductase anchor subunit [Mannheimia cairinae]
MNGLHELPLIIFTVLAQSVVGCWLFFSFVLCRYSHSEQSRSYLHKAMFIPLALLAIGFVASVMHLGSPLRAFNSLNRVGESMLSNEIASGAAFFALAGLYWLLAILGKMPAGFAKIWLILTACIGLVFMYMMNNLYHISTVPTWNTVFTSWQFYLTVVIGGSALAYVLLALNPHKEYPLCYFPWVYMVAVFLAAIVVVYQGFGLSQIHSSAMQAANLVPDYAIMHVVRLCLLALGGILLFKVKNNISLGLAVILVLFAEMIGRTVFYGLHMTVGMAVAG